MLTGFLAFMIVVPIAAFLIIYRCFNNGNLPCVNTSNIDVLRVGVESE